MTDPSLLVAQELPAPAHWRTVELISDVHLQASEAETFDAWRRFMASTSADALFILGDLFEVWVGDDDAAQPGFSAECASVLRAASRRLPVYLLHGNRDFLVGDGFAASCSITLLRDPAVLTFAGMRWLLTHGDALCLADAEYVRFRGQVRQPAWQHEFLAQPLEARRQIARGMREQSEAAHRSQHVYADVDETAAVQWLQAADASVMIHGHTHRPGQHALPGGRQRIVLSDWEASGPAPRLEALRLSAAGPQRIRLG